MPVQLFKSRQHLASQAQFYCKQLPRKHTCEYVQRGLDSTYTLEWVDIKFCRSTYVIVFKSLQVRSHVSRFVAFSKVSILSFVCRKLIFTRNSLALSCLCALCKSSLLARLLQRYMDTRDLKIGVYGRPLTANCKL